MFPVASPDTPDTSSNSVAEDVCTCTWVIPLLVNSVGRLLTAKFGALTPATVARGSWISSTWPATDDERRSTILQRFVRRA